MAIKGLQLKTVGEFVSKNWEKLPDIIATGRDISNAIKGKKGTSYVQTVANNVKDATQSAKEAASNVDTIKKVSIVIGVLIGAVVLFFLLRRR